MLAGIVIACELESKDLIGVHAGVIVDIAHKLFGQQAQPPNNSFKPKALRELA